MFCRSLFVLLYFFFLPLCCLFFFDIRILIIPLVQSNFSYIMSHWALAQHRRVSFQFHDKYIAVAADKSPNNISSVCVIFYKDPVIKDLGVDNSHRNSTYTQLHCCNIKLTLIVDFRSPSRFPRDNPSRYVTSFYRWNKVDTTSRRFINGKITLYACW
jgi:hypothetical protein